MMKIKSENQIKKCRVRIFLQFIVGEIIKISQHGLKKPLKIDSFLTFGSLIFFYFFLELNELTLRK